MEGSPVPDSLDNVGSGVVVEIIHEIFSPKVTMSVSGVHHPRGVFTHCHNVIIVCTIRYLLAVLSIGHRCIIAEEKLPVEKLNSNHSEDKKKENVDNENIKNVLQ